MRLKLINFLFSLYALHRFTKEVFADVWLFRFDKGRFGLIRRLHGAKSEAEEGDSGSSGLKENDQLYGS